MLSFVFVSQEFSAFVKNLRVQSLKKRDVQLLFDDLCQPEKGHLTVANLYRNIDKKDNLSKAEINLRWVEIFGSSKQAFHDVANVDPKDDCTEAAFIRYANRYCSEPECDDRTWNESEKENRTRARDCGVGAAGRGGEVFFVDCSIDVQLKVKGMLETQTSGGTHSFSFDSTNDRRRRLPESVTLLKKTENGHGSRADV